MLCTSEVPNATLANGNVTFAGRGTTQYIKLYEREVKYDDILPNFMASYRFGEGHWSMVRTAPRCRLRARTACTP